MADAWSRVCRLTVGVVGLESPRVTGHSRPPLPGQGLRVHSGPHVPRSGERAQGPVEDAASPKPVRPRRLSLVGWSPGPPWGAAGASGHLPQAVPRAPPGTGGQSSITPATSGSLVE